MSDKGVAGSRLTRLGRYEVLSELGKGAMGIVYLAKDPVIGRMVAIKTIRVSNMGDDDSESREFRERFLREAQTAGILSHPNIVTIHDIGEDPETRISFIAMEYIEGKNLKSMVMEKTKFTYDQISNMISQVAEAIDYAHRKGIIHRDVKPANIIITADEKVKITDFGIAKIASSNLTTTGQFLGTPNYMSPEQVSGSPVDGRSDIFSLGVVLYELLTGRKPFTGDNLTAISYKIVHEDFTPPAELSSEVPPEFNPIVARAMAKDPWNRYQRGKDFALALQQLRAHLEEQKALQELGTFVSSPESMATVKLTNIGEMAAEALATSQSRPAPAAGAPSAGAPVAAASPPAAAGAASPAPAASAPAAAPPAAARLAGSAPSPAPSRPADAKPQPAARPAGRLAPGFLAGSLAALKKTMASASGNRARTDWRALAKRSIAAPRFWIIAGGAGALLVLVVAALLIVRGAASKPTVPFDASLARQNVDHRQTLEEGKKLLAARRYEESAALLRKLLAADPNNRQARQYLQMAEAGAAGRESEAKKVAETQRIVELAQSAFAQSNYEEARKQAEEALALDASRADAQKIRDDASTKIAEAEAAKKKLARAAATPSTRRASAAPARGARPEHAVPTAAAAIAPSTSASGASVLRLLFDSPLSEGHVMVAVNDEILLRKPFSFVRKEGLFKTIKGTGTVDASIPVKAGPLNIKVWLSGPDIPASILATTSAQIAAGGSRTLKVEYSSGRLSAKVQ